MNYSGIYLTAQPAKREEVMQTIESFSWADIYYQDEKGQFIVTAEGENIDQDIERLRTLKGIPGVLSAEMAHHHFEDESDALLENVKETAPQVENYLLNENLHEAGSNHYQRLKRLTNF